MRKWRCTVKKLAGIATVIVALVAALVLAVPLIGCEIPEPAQDVWSDFRHGLTNT